MFEKRESEMVQKKAAVAMVKYKYRSPDSFLMFWREDFLKYILTNSESERIKYFWVPSTSTVRVMP